MTGFVIERGGYPNAVLLIKALANDMIENGFTLVAPAAIPESDVSPLRILLESTENVDPLAPEQAWRIMFDVQQDQRAFCYTGTSTTLVNTSYLPLHTEFGNTTAVTSSGSPNVIKRMVPTDVIGNVGFKMGSKDYSTGNVISPAHLLDTGEWVPEVEVKQSGGSGNQTQYGNIKDNPKYGIINREARIGTALGNAYPLRYRLVISDHGVWFGIWEEAESDNSAYLFNWVLVQRPVDRVSGNIVVDGKAPVWCVSYNAGNVDFNTKNDFYFHQMVVRESDVLKPNAGELTVAHRRADIASDDSDAILNAENQVALSEDGKYIVTFPARLNTSRFCYSHELDMIGFTSADVVSNGTIVPLKVYEENDDREYLAMKASGRNNTGVRLVVQISGRGITQSAPV